MGTYMGVVTGSQVYIVFPGNTGQTYTVDFGNGNSTTKTSDTGLTIQYNYAYSGKYIITVNTSLNVTGTPYYKVNNNKLYFTTNTREQNKIILPYEIMKKLYPVGSIYMSVNSTNPGTRFYGAWEQIKDRFLLGSGDKTLGSTGGEATHTLTESELPKHSHVQNNTPSIVANRIAPSGSYRIADVQTTTYTEYTGGGQAHNNMPPYLTVYMWRRVV